MSDKNTGTTAGMLAAWRACHPDAQRPSQKISKELKEKLEQLRMFNPDEAAAIEQAIDTSGGENE